MARVIPRKKLKKTGTGVLEYAPDEEEPMDPGDPYQGLMGIAWFDGHSIEVDGSGHKSIGMLKPGERYNKRNGWRIWESAAGSSAGSPGSPLTPTGGR